jgi:hypothetical protein
MNETCMNENQIEKNKILRPRKDKTHYPGHFLKVWCTRFIVKQGYAFNAQGSKINA